MPADEPVQPEIWLRGPVAGVPTQLQSVAHALMQAHEDTERLVAGLQPAELWSSPCGAASIGFHVRHMAGSLDRLLTYAAGEQLSESQRAALAEEKVDTPSVSSAELLGTLRSAIDGALARLRATRPEELDEPRDVGRARLPSTVRGLLHHAGEHTARHAGQISTTVRVVRCS
jgi:hypothetical protein